MMALLVVAWLCVFYYRADEGNVATICEFDAQNQRYTVERYIVKDGEHIPLESSNPEQICTRLERDAQF
ncbi:hypothetical protein SAMN05421749_101615 [Acinetobacter marinus]|uniref:Uncharacterized protein n=2 Tax=Acinetobacter marinus TaxID=281375 RepID=A0A1G6H091_9GAMM|nr:hypothetical protein SAMN05421749_101615 [Acinetobacter marinus]